MIVDWLAPISAIVFSTRLLWAQVREGWRDWEDALKLLGTALVCYCMFWIGLDATKSLGESIVLSTVMLTVAFIPPRFALRLIRAKRPNEIEDPELFEDGELKSEDQLKELGAPRQD